MLFFERVCRLLAPTINKASHGYLYKPSYLSGAKRDSSTLTSNTGCLGCHPAISRQTGRERRTLDYQRGSGDGRRAANGFWFKLAALPSSFLIYLLYRGNARGDPIFTNATRTPKNANAIIGVNKPAPRSEMVYLQTFKT